MTFEAEDETNSLDADDETNAIPKPQPKGVPIDKGWAWVVLAGCVLYTAIAGGINRSFGVFFLEFQERFQATAGEVAMMSMIQNITISITGLLTMTVGVKMFSCRLLLAVGGGLNALSHIFSGVTTDIRVFYLSHGLLGGMGIVLAGPTLISTIGVYFNKHRGLANSIVAGSASVGGLMFAPVITTLFEEYGYTGAMIIVAGLLLNTFVTAALMRPPSWFTSAMKLDEKLLADTIDDDRLDVSEELCIQSELIKLEHQDDCKSNLYSVKCTQMEESCYSEDDHSCQCDKAIISSPDKGNQGPRVICDSAPSSANTNTCFHTIKATLSDVIKAFDFKLLKDLNCILYLLMAFFTVSGMALIPFYLPPFAKDALMTYDEIALMVSITACVECFSKIASGIIADRQWIRRSTLLALGAFVTGTLCQFARYYNSKTHIMVMAAFMAGFFGWYMSMYAPILIDSVGLEKFHSCLGFLCIVHGFSAALFFPLSGLLRDLSGAYIYSLHMAGGLCFAGAITLILVTFVQSRN